MTPTRVPSRMRSLTGLALAALVLLTGCGSVPDFNPGVAARVGDDTVSVDEVDDLAKSYCGAAEAQLQDGQALPNHYLRGEVAGALALRAAADQLMAEHDVEPDESYDRAVAQAATQLGSLPQEQSDALIEVQGAALYVDAAQLAVGRAVLADRGAGSGDRAATAAGEKAFQSWLDDHDIRIDPRFGVAIEDGQSVRADTGVSYALGETATKADAEQPDSDYAAALPDTQRCG